MKKSETVAGIVFEVDTDAHALQIGHYSFSRKHIERVHRIMGLLLGTKNDEENKLVSSPAFDILAATLQVLSTVSCDLVLQTAVGEYSAIVRDVDELDILELESWGSLDDTIVRIAKLVLEKFPVAQPVQKTPNEILAEALKKA